MKRERLGNLIEQLGPERTGHGGYRAKMHWTVLGTPHCRLAAEIRAANAA
ncbi:MAG: hypothetical protein HY329_24015 [Chloroflexi bacterium]|nr:hypothetical protein [Chloroflexota bacterium]